ncbi:MAG TPA: tRNA pseudouridine(38-40) synthase TruA [Candidatus Cloacimonetes bacterium]|nr:tRNA pseudouridine(38-40) synthase TruA [Candidatus Cloacimonadota bacterium]HEX38174.1 tRNA pseudouridine(38-40) synthase TruA [Candidatus Cloacimonadota bacterium]
MKKFLIQLSYDGHSFHGWQIQNDIVTIQSVIEEALEKIFKTQIRIIVSGRTDAGVHALNQYAHFEVSTRMTSENIVAALNATIPDAIYVKGCKNVPENFHARFSAKKRTYLYKIMKQYSPFERFYSSFFPGTLIDISILDKLSKILIGTHDFKVFAHDTSQLNSTLCTLEKAEWIEDDTHYYFYISANRFLHNMVRRIVGTLIFICDNQLKSKYLEQLLRDQDYTKLGTTAPPEGLYLYDVEYN